MKSLFIALILSLAPLARAQEAIKPIPPIGKELPAVDKAELEGAIAHLDKEIRMLRLTLESKPALLALLPDIQIYHNALRYPLIYHEPIDMKSARAALAEADDRLAQLHVGQVKWVNISGPRGYVSRIDKSVQPYVLTIPPTYNPDDKATRHRFDFWCHGRGEDLMELKFIRGKGESAPDHFVVNLYGRYCCANKFAGEIDLLEALEDVKKRYPVDENRLVDIGFSMGGAAAWQFAVHYTDLFAAASPGAGFSEAREFLHIKPEEVEAMKPWQKSLWHLYDCTDSAANIAMLPTVAYAGEIDGQKQASDMMEKAMAAEGLKMERLIGPKTGHKYEPETRKQLDKRLAEICAIGRNPTPDHIRFTTWTLRYNRMFWVELTGLEKHWERARVDALLTSPDAIEVKTANVSSLILDVPATAGKFAPDSKVTITIDGRKLEATSNKERGLHVFAQKTSAGWSIPVDPLMPLHKRHGLQGPIDDAFMDAFLIVKPTGKPENDKTAVWAASECDHAIAHWQKQFRGEAQVEFDTAVTDAEIRDNNLIFFGDPTINKTLAKIADKLPIQWKDGKLIVGDKSFDAAHHMPALIFPNPLNPQRYVVLNSGFTFRDFDYLNNARQTPKLPDYAIIDVDTPVTPKAPGNIVEAGFFDEQWQLRK
ncbi:MAG: alpha/beta hydrolase: peptidase or carbohydrate esterase [Phycisphaerales bacterium]|nr:alpha/beta hydrolase: peptidase or carbohydrate esterase [Phycisphaerales bacterium]